jgi:8-oxo-dGTP pyrophosphatase MutT (NUDIX family)
MHRRPLTELLQRYAAAGPGAAEIAARFLAFASAHGDCLLRSCGPGHVTASAWILSADGGACLLTRHRKLGKWLQLGGHVDGEERVERAALREAREESGLQSFEMLAPAGVLLPLDLDVHPIPARGSEPEHLHWDVRFLLRAAPGQQLAISDESDDLRWIPLQRLSEFTQEESVLRLQRAAERWLAGGARPLRAT